MHLKEQSYVLALEQNRNITKAAKKLGISQPALTAFLNNLENSLGAELFDRTEKPLKLTPVGELYVKKAKEMMELKKEFDEEFAYLTGQDYPSLRVGIQEIRVPHIVPPMIMALNQEFPNLEVTFYENNGKNLYEMLKSGQIDLLLSNKWADISGMDTEYLMTDRFLFITPPNHPLNARQSRIKDPYPSIDISLFKNENFMLLSKEHTIRHFSDTIFQHLGWEPQNLEVYTRTETIINLVGAGMGVSFVLESYLDYFKSYRKPCCFLVGDPPVTIDYVALFPKKKRNSPVFCRFLEMVRFVLSK